MKIRANLLHCFAIATLSGLLASGCDDAASNKPHEEQPEEDIILAAPFANSKEFKYIHPGFSVSADSGAPWRFAHLGMDLIAAKSGARVVAPARGVVDELKIYQNEHNGQWQVNLGVHFNSSFRYHILFEPRAHSQDEVEQQRSAIPLVLGQQLQQGEFIGTILDLSSGDLSAGEVTIHFDIWKGQKNICPAPYFTAEAYTGMLALVRAMYPGAELCYP